MVFTRQGRSHSIIDKTIVKEGAAFGAFINERLVGFCSAEESQKFYRRLGCVDTKEIDRYLYELEPYDCHLEFDLVSKV